MQKFDKVIALGVASLFSLSVAHADVLLSDNFTVSNPGVGDANSKLNQDLSTRQAGYYAPACYSGWSGQHQVGNNETWVGQPGGASNPNYVLLAGNASFWSGLNIASIASGPLSIEFDVYMTLGGPGDQNGWTAVTLREGGESDCWPITGAGEFGFLVQQDGGLQVWGGSALAGWNNAGTAPSPHFQLIFTDAAGTGSAFNGNGSQVTFVNGGNTLGTVTLGQLNSKGLRLGFRTIDNKYAGIANLLLTGTPGELPADRNLSFERDQELPGKSVNIIPTSWTGFNISGRDRMGSQCAGGVDYTVFNPLSASGDGSQFYWINRWNGDGLGGIYKDMGALQPNTIYTLTVAIGSRADRINSPGIISLINGTDNNGTVMVTGGGLPATQNTWQDYSVSFTNADLAGNLTIMLSVLGNDATIQANFDNVRLTTAPAPAIVAPTMLTDIHPLISRVTTGAPLTFSVTATGTSLNYQWFNQSGPISGATSPSYSFNAVAGTSSYYVSVSNSANAIVSSTAVVVSAENIVTVNNFSFESGTTSGPGGGTLPVAWTQGGFVNWCTVAAGGYPAMPEGTHFFAINEGPSDPTGGIYQDVGALKANTTYTLTVAIAHSDWLNSPGIISLLNGADNTGTVLASTSGFPDAASTWQDYTATFSTGASASGDLIVYLSVAGAGTWQAHMDNVRLTAEPVVPAVAPTIAAPVISGGNLILSGTGGTPNRAYTVQTTTDLSTTPIVWFTQTTGSLDGTGAISASIPVDTAKSASFFRVLMQ